MTRYTVLWTEAAEDDLAEIWCAYSDRQVITAAADKIDVELREDATLKGLPLSDGSKVISSGPLSIFFRVSPADRKVVVGSVQLSESN